MMKQGTILLLLYCLGCLILAGCSPSSASKTKKQSGVSAETKLSQITELALNSKGNVITLDDSTYSYYAINKPRPYSLIVYFTASHPKFKCGICKQLDTELSILAQSYMKTYKPNTMMMDGTDDDGTGQQLPVFFLRLDYESSSRVFQNYGVNSVPLLFHLPATTITSTTASTSTSTSSNNEKYEKDYHILIRDKFQISSDPDAEALASFLHDRTGISVSITRSMFWSYILLIIIFTILAALIQPIINSLPFWLRLIQWRPLWMVVSYGIYTCAISGLIFDIIRSPQMYYANPSTGQIMFFYPQSGNQFVVEGFIIGFLNLACAIALVILAIYAPYFKDAQTRNITILASIFIFAFCFRTVRSLYVMKNRWYGQRF